jgi:hypothetical protein
MPRRFEERAEALTVILILTQVLMYLFRADPKLAKVLPDALQRAIDDFRFVDGWSAEDEMRARESMRHAADKIIGLAHPSVRRKRGG